VDTGRPWTADCRLNIGTQSSSSCRCSCAYAIGTDLGLLETYHELGARYITFAHNGHNDIADSANPSAPLGDKEEEHGGVSAFGRQVIAEMNRLGIMVDVTSTTPSS